MFETVSRLALGTAIEVWFQEQMRVGQKNSLVYQWAKKGTRPRQPKDQRYENAYLFGAVCPSRDTGAAIIMPHANTAAMRRHLKEISHVVAPGAHAMVILDQAGWLPGHPSGEMGRRQMHAVCRAGGQIMAK